MRPSQTSVPLPKWTPQPKQAQFLSCEADELLYGGAAGGGKSFGLLQWAFDRCASAPNVGVVLARKKLTQLRDTGGLIPTSIELLAGKGWHWRATDLVWVAPNGSTIQFKQVGDNLRDTIEGWQGAAPHFLGLEEAGQMAGPQIDFCIGRVRTGREGIRPLIRLTANPGGPGHSYLYNRFVRPAAEGVVWQPPREAGRTIDPATRCYIRALVTDNAALMGANPQYLANLENLPEPLRSAYRWGKWDIFVGQFFSEWDPTVHLCEPFTLPSWWTRIAGMDWGYNHPTVVLWAAVSPEGVVHVYREMWLRFAHVDGPDGIAARIQGQTIALEDRDYHARTTVRQAEDRVPRIAAGPDVFSLQHTTLGGPSIAQQFGAEGVPLYNPMGGRRRIHQWQQARKYLQWSTPDGGRMEGRPLLRVFRGACPRLEACLPEMQFSDTDSEDLKKVDIHPDSGEGGDDAADALAYLLMQRPWIGARPELEAPVAPGSPESFRRHDRRLREQDESASLKR